MTSYLQKLDLEGLFQAKFRTRRYIAKLLLDLRKVQRKIQSLHNEKLPKKLIDRKTWLKAKINGQRMRLDWNDKYIAEMHNHERKHQVTMPSIEYLRETRSLRDYITITVKENGDYNYVSPSTISESVIIQVVEILLNELEWSKEND